MPNFAAERDQIQPPVSPWYPPMEALARVYCNPEIVDADEGLSFPQRTLSHLIESAATSSRDNGAQTERIAILVHQLSDAFSTLGLSAPESPHGEIAPEALARMCDAISGTFERREAVLTLFCHLTAAAAGNMPKLAALAHFVDIASLFALKHFHSMFSHVQAGITKASDHSQSLASAMILTADTVELLSDSPDVEQLASLWKSLKLFPSPEQLEELRELVATSRHRAELLAAVRLFSEQHYGLLPRADELARLADGISRERDYEGQTTKLLLTRVATNIKPAISNSHEFEIFFAGLGLGVAGLGTLGAIMQGLPGWGTVIGAGMAFASLCTAFMFRSHRIYSRADGFKLGAIWDGLVGLERCAACVDRDGELLDGERLAQALLKS